MTVANGDDNAKSKRLDESEMTPAMLAEHRRLQHELQCQEALLVLMQKLKANQRLISQTNNNGIKQRTTATKLSQQVTLPEGKNSITAAKQQQPQVEYLAMAFPGLHSLSRLSDQLEPIDTDKNTASQSVHRQSLEPEFSTCTAAILVVENLARTTSGYPPVESRQQLLQLVTSRGHSYLRHSARIRNEELLRDGSDQQFLVEKYAP